MLTAGKHQDAVGPCLDNHLLDRLMDEARIDVALTTSKHNVQYLLGGHRTFFFDHMEAMGRAAICQCWLSQRRARTGFLCRPWDRELPACAQSALDAGGVHRAGWLN